MSRKPKIDFETKIKSVEIYLKCEKSPTTIYKEIGVSKTTFRNWVYKYTKYGAEGLKTPSRNTFYSNETKILAINDYLSCKGSIDDICRRYSILSGSSL